MFAATHQILMRMVLSDYNYGEEEENTPGHKVPLQAKEGDVSIRRIVKRNN